MDELLDRVMTEEGREGFVVEFADGQMVKIKTSWYLARHAWVTDQKKQLKPGDVELDLDLLQVSDD